jgi:hypothetical protein
MTRANSSDSSEESPASVETLSETAPLLSPSSEAEAGCETAAAITTSDLLSNVEGGPIEAHKPPDEDPKPKNAFAIIGLLLIGVFVSNTDGTLVIAMYAGISSEFGAFENAAWLTTSYMLATCAVQGIVGKLSDIYGRKSVLLISYVGFAVGSMLMSVPFEY